MDEIDVRREGRLAAERSARVSCVSLKTVQGIRWQDIQTQYQIAVQYEGIPSDNWAWHAFRDGWCGVKWISLYKNANSHV